MSSTKSIIISSAGIGSRLGLSTTKALININGRPLIHWQLDLFKEIENVRVVVGFQANEVIETVTQVRPDAIFVYNHRYFETKTGASYYLGARHGNKYAIEYDGDLLVHPDDMRHLLKQDGEWIAYADKMSDDSVMVTTNQNGEVESFTRDEGDYEWTGPCCLRRDRIHFISGHVYNQLEPYLPMKGIKIRACDIDTYGDYQRAVAIIKEWYK